MSHLTQLYLSLSIFAFGYGIRMTGLVDKPFLVRLIQMIFKVFFPVMMFNNIYRIDAGTLVNPLLVGVNILCVFAVIGCAMLWFPACKRKFQTGRNRPGNLPGQLRPLCIPLAENVFGPKAAVLLLSAFPLLFPFTMLWPF